ncbi:MAG: hypothetical protein R2702_11485 [Acidimicrobiales bacterium]
MSGGVRAAGAAASSPPYLRPDGAVAARCAADWNGATLDGVPGLGETGTRHELVPGVAAAHRTALLYTDAPVGL